MELREMDQAWQARLAGALEATRVMERDKAEAQLEECRRYVQESFRKELELH